MSETKRKLEPSDVGCPICLEILIEPITMPCSHKMCRPCFEKNLELTNLHCPFCKKRIATWARKAKNIKTLIDQCLWEKIQADFPDLVASRVSGESNSNTDVLFQTEWSHDICESGVIGSEFRAQLEAERLEQAERARAEEEESKKLIEELLKEETSEAGTSIVRQQGNNTKPTQFETDENKILVRPILSQGSRSLNAKPVAKKDCDLRKFLKVMPPSTSTSQVKTSRKENSTVERFRDSEPSFHEMSEQVELDGIELTPELLELQRRVEASILQQKEDEALARSLQEKENVTSPQTRSAKRPRPATPRQTTLEELFSGSKRRKE